ncbi:MAG TPA: TrmB family transcriptional regulator sugar-binding domain-containing protein, partial [Aggregatilineales bacterium]|nr:TrmB family transcriptional regulator sugar-binding domain-containing protein [Aggregatilineales bacterium]
QIYSAREDEHLWSIEGRVPVFTYAGQMIREAERDIMCVLADPELDLLRKDLVRAEERGTTIRALLTGQGELKAGQVAHHPPLESELQKITQMAMVIRDNSEVLIANMGLETTATITRNHNLVFIAGQFVWMELFAQRVYARLGPELLARLEPDDRQIFESLDQGLEPLALRSEKLKGNR